MATDIKIYILKWHYSDNSAFGIERVYLNFNRAEQDFKLVTEAAGSKIYELQEIEPTS